MKKIALIFRTNAIVLAIFLLNFNANAQAGYVREYYTGCYFHTTANSIFTWSGDCIGGYCNGYGTIQWYKSSGEKIDKFVGTLVNGKAEGFAIQYYPNGNKYYEGLWRNDMRNGYGTSYNSDGTIQFQGYFEGDEFKDYTKFNQLGYEIASEVVRDIFKGGINLETKVVKMVYDKDGTFHEIRIKMYFNGNIVTSNIYRCTLILKDTGIPLDFVDYNDSVDSFLKLVVGVTLYTEGKKFIDSLKK